MPLSPPLGFEPRQKRGIAARDRVFEEALRQFAAKGVEETRVEDIVAAAGVAWGTFFRYFPRKEDVLLAAGVGYQVQRLGPMVNEALADPDRPAREIGLELFLALLSPADYPPRLHAAIVLEGVRERDRFIAMLGQDDIELQQLALRIVRRGQAQGAVRDDTDPRLLAGVLSTGTVFTTLYGYYDLVLGDPRLAAADPAPDPKPIITGAFDVVWRGIRPD
jgi:AcrR family transcriptional regulator